MEKASGQLVYRHALAACLCISIIPYVLICGNSQELLLAVLR